MVRVDDSASVTKCWLDRDELLEIKDAAAASLTTSRLPSKIGVLGVRSSTPATARSVVTR